MTYVVAVLVALAILNGAIPLIVSFWTTEDIAFLIYMILVSIFLLLLSMQIDKLNVWGKKKAK